jgi:hypothetical protein
MTITQLIDMLEIAKRDYGDLAVYLPDYWDDAYEAESVRLHEADDKWPRHVYIT